MPTPTPEVRYLAAFAWEGSPRLAGWKDCPAGSSYTSELDFLLDSARAIFEPSVGGPNGAGVRILVPQDASDRVAFLFPEGVGLLVLEEEAAQEPLWSRLRSQESARRSTAGSLDDLFPGTWRWTLYGPRLLTWTLHAVEGPRSPLAYALTEHRDPEAPNRIRPEALKRLFRKQGYQVWTSWSAFYHRDNAAVLVQADLLAPEELDQVLRMHRGDLFRMYLLSLSLKLRLTRFLDDLAGRPPTEHHTIEEESLHLGRIYEEHYEQYLDFQTNDWFAEVTRHTTGRAVYRVMRRALGLRPLLREVRSEIRLLRQAWSTKLRKVERDRDRRHRDRAEADSQRLSLITTYALPFLAATGAMGMNLPFWGTTGEDHFGRWVWFLFFFGVTWLAIQSFLGTWKPKAVRTSTRTAPERTR